MNLGQLMDLIDEHRRIERDIKEAKAGLAFGGSPSTVQAKHEVVEMHERLLAMHREQELGDLS